jgi:hypothetical protein
MPIEHIERHPHYNRQNFLCPNIVSVRPLFYPLLLGWHEELTFICINFALTYEAHESQRRFNCSLLPKRFSPSPSWPKYASSAFRLFVVRALNPSRIWKMLLFMTKTRGKGANKLCFYR